MTCRDPPLYTLLSALSQAQNSPAKLRAKHQHLQPASQLALRSLITCQGWDRLYCSSGCPGAIPFLHQHLWSHCSPLPCNKPRQSQEQRWVQGLQTEPQLLWIFFYRVRNTLFTPMSNLGPQFLSSISHTTWLHLPCKCKPQHSAEHSPQPTRGCWGLYTHFTAQAQLSTEHIRIFSVSFFPPFFWKISPETDKEDAFLPPRKNENYNPIYIAKDTLLQGAEQEGWKKCKLTQKLWATVDVARSLVWDQDAILSYFFLLFYFEALDRYSNHTAGKAGKQSFQDLQIHTTALRWGILSHGQGWRSSTIELVRTGRVY